MAKGRHHQRRSLSIRSTANVLIIIMISALLGKMHRRGFAVAFVQGIRREGGGSRLLLSCADDSSSSPFGRVVHHLHGVTRTLFPIFPVRHFSAKRNNQIDSASRASYDQSLTEKLNLLDEQESIVTNDQQIVEVVEELIKPSGWRRSLYRRAGGALSAIGFVTSASRALWLPDPEQSRQWKPTVDALRAFLQTTGIDSELSALLNVRLLDNIIILSRIEKAALKGEDRRDRVLSEAAVSISNDEALRYVSYGMTTKDQGPLAHLLDSHFFKCKSDI